MRIEFKNLIKAYDQILFNIHNYQFESGRINGIIGPNGAGKTTLLRMIAGLDQEFDGEIYYDDAKDINSVFKKISYISQKPYMLKRSVYDNIAYPLQIRGYGKDDIEERVHFWLIKMNLLDMEKRKAASLSAGEKQKLSLARGLIYTPEIVLLDEPTANIDPETVRLIEDTILQYSIEHKATVFLVTHDLAQAIRVCDELFGLERKTFRVISKKEILSKVSDLTEVHQSIEVGYNILGG